MKRKRFVLLVAKHVFLLLVSIVFCFLCDHLSGSFQDGG